MKLPQDFIIPEGFRDSTWQNDICPSIENKKLGLKIYIDDTLEDADRIYGIYMYNNDTDQYDHEFDTESWEDVKAIINAARLDNINN